MMIDAKRCATCDRFLPRSYLDGDELCALCGDLDDRTEADVRLMDIAETVTRWTWEMADPETTYRRKLELSVQIKALQREVTDILAQVP